jgi:hypothetical protein
VGGEPPFFFQETGMKVIAVFTVKLTVEIPDEEAELADGLGETPIEISGWDDYQHHVEVKFEGARGVVEE